MSAMSEELLSALLDGECTPAEAEAVLAANGGAIPGTNEELVAVAQKLS